MYVRRRQYYGCLRVSYGLTMWEQLLSLTVDCGNGYNSEEKRLERVFVSLFTSSQPSPQQQQDQSRGQSQSQ
jgi:hypothetical protein